MLLKKMLYTLSVLGMITSASNVYSSGFLHTSLAEEDPVIFFEDAGSFTQTFQVSSAEPVEIRLIFDCYENAPMNTINYDKLGVDAYTDKRKGYDIYTTRDTRYLRMDVIDPVTGEDFDLASCSIMKDTYSSYTDSRLRFYKQKGGAFVEKEVIIRVTNTSSKSNSVLDSIIWKR